MGKIYTRTGDGGDTSFFDGSRTSKADPRVDLYGDVDELGSILGICMAKLESGAMVAAAAGVGDSPSPEPDAPSGAEEPGARRPARRDGEPAGPEGAARAALDRPRARDASGDLGVGEMGATGEAATLPDPLKPEPGAGPGVGGPTDFFARPFPQGRIHISAAGIPIGASPPVPPAPDRAPEPAAAGAAPRPGQGGASAPASPADLAALLATRQRELFELGAILADPGRSRDLAAAGPEGLPLSAAALERQIDAMTELLPPLRNFILPGGEPAAAHLHHARTVCRRAERRAVALAAREPVPAGVIVYLNRLSDFLFVAARWANHLGGRRDVIWPGS